MTAHTITAYKSELRQMTDKELDNHSSRVRVTSIFHRESCRALITAIKKEYWQRGRADICAALDA